MATRERSCRLEGEDEFLLMMYYLFWTMICCQFFRGMMALEILEAIETECGGQRIYELFDCVVGSSTGAIIGSLLAGFRLTVPQCKDVYR